MSGEAILEAAALRKEYGPVVAVDDADLTVAASFAAAPSAGYGADVTVLADDPVDLDPDELVSLPVLLTVVDGEGVFGGL